MNTVRYAVVGAGNQGTYYATAIDSGKVPNAVLSAVCDINPVKIENIKSKVHGDVKYFDDFDTMLAAGVCDAVLVVVPHYLHPEMVIKCLEKNIHVITDKPAGVYTKQVREMNAVAEKSSALFGMMFNQRANCLYRKMREIIKEGGIGELQRVNWIITDWFRTQNYYDSGTWRATWKGEGGGVLINQCPHQIDLVSWVVGEMPSSVNAFCKYGKWHDIEVEDEVTAYFEYKSGASGVFITTTGEAPGTNRFEVSGTKGKLLCETEKLYYYKNEIDSQEFCKTSKESFAKPKCEVIEPETDGENLQHVKILRNFTETILGRETLFVDGKEGINGVELMKRVAVSRYKQGNDNAIESKLNFGTGCTEVKNGK